VIAGERAEESAGEASYVQSQQLFHVDFHILLEMARHACEENSDTRPHPRLLWTVLMMASFLLAVASFLYGWFSVNR
jgi:hypothetical protein